MPVRNSDGAGTWRIHDPTSRPAVPRRPTARRLPSLEGISLGILDNGKSNADRFLSAVAERLRRDHRAASVVTARKPNAWALAAPEVRARLVECGAVITAFGD